MLNAHPNEVGPLLFAAVLCGCAEPDSGDHSAPLLVRDGEESASPASWIIEYDDDVAAINEESFQEGDEVVVDEVVLDNGVAVTFLEEPGGGIGAVLHGPPSGVSEMEEVGETYSALEIALSVPGLESAVDARLWEDHAALAIADLVPAAPRELPLVDRPRNIAHPSPDTWCLDLNQDGQGDYTAHFLLNWEFQRYSCPTPPDLAHLCGSDSNNNYGIQTSVDYYIVTGSGGEQALLSCNGLAQNFDQISINLQEYIGGGNWEIFYTMHHVAEENGLGYARKSLQTSQFRMRMYNITNGTLTYAAAQW